MGSALHAGQRTGPSRRMKPQVTVAIPTLNGMSTLPDVIARVRAQQVDADVELLAVDSGSGDGTREHLRQVADRVIELRPGEFNHGTTRNLAVEEARGELVVMLVQDAAP